MGTQIKQRYIETNRIMNQMYLEYIYRIFHPKTKDYSFFSASHGTFSTFRKIDYVIGHKTGLNRYKKIEMSDASDQVTTD
jgi:exonuclease III